MAEDAHGHLAIWALPVEFVHVLEEAVGGALAEQGPLALATVLGLAVAVGAFHALLPGHGKAMLAAHHASRTGLGPKRTGLLLSVRDGAFIGAMRVASAALLVWIGLGAASFLPAPTGDPHEAAEGPVRLVGGLVLAAIGLWLVWSAWRPVRRTSLPLMAFGLVPDPVAMGFIIAATVVGKPLAGMLAALGVAAGMSFTLTAAAVTGTRVGGILAGERADQGHRWLLALRVGGGCVVILVGLGLALS